MSGKILIATVKPFAKDAVEAIKKIAGENGYETALLESYSEEEQLISAVKDAEALIIRSDKIHSGIINTANKLKIIVRAGAGYDNVDIETAKHKQIVVMNTPGQNSNAVAELALGLMLYSARNKFNGKAGTELKGKKLGIHAYGHVGKAVAVIASGFGMEVFAFDPFIDNKIIESDGVTPLKTVEELYKTCRYISLHIPANEKTKDSINDKLLSLLPKNGVLVNTARKEVVCEDSLKKILNEREDISYLSDIAPDCEKYLLENYSSQCFFTPKKMGAQTAEANINAGIAAINQIIGFLKRGDRTFQVNN